jgi:hypothetical protein
VVGFGIYCLVNGIAHARTPTDGTFTFEPRGRAGAFEARLVNYTHGIEYMITLATGAIVLLVGSSAWHSNGRMPWLFASPLVLLAFSVVYGMGFMAFMVFYYEEFLHYDNYTRSRFIRNQTLGFSALACFCLGYLWLVLSVVIGLAN